MGMCKPSGGKSDAFGRLGKNIKEISDQTPNSRVDYRDEITGELLQQRWYGPDGNAIWDRDFKHKNDNPKNPHTFPHDHYWVYGDKIDRPEYKGENGELTNEYYC